jgi:prepilin-type N-terminal cleavage/methylation domain-containing protein
MAKNQRGFTLFELLVVVVIVSIILTFGAYFVRKELRKVENRGCLSGLYQVLKGLQLEAMRKKGFFSIEVEGDTISATGLDSLVFHLKGCNFSATTLEVGPLGVFSSTPVVIRNLNAPAGEPDNLTITPVLIFSP